MFNFPPIPGWNVDRQLTDLRREPPPRHVLGPDGLFDAVHFLLVALAVPHGALLGLLQGVLQGFDPLGRGPQTLLQLGQLAAEVRVVSNQLEGRFTLVRLLKCSMHQKVLVHP